MTRMWLREIVVAIGVGLVCTPVTAAAVFFFLSNWQAKTGTTVIQAQTAGVFEEYTANTVNPQVVPTVQAASDTPKTITPSGPEKFLLDIPLIKQKYSLSCEMASLEMALKYRNIDVTQEDLTQKLGYAQPIEKQVVNDKIIWGDPDIGFVGSEKGFFYTTKEGLRGATGWGVNPGPVARLADAYRPGSLAKNGASLNDLKDAIRLGKPVIFWHQRDDVTQKGTLVYQTPTGKQVTLLEDHVNLLIGFETDGQSQTTYYFNDPFYGQIKMKEPDLIRVWAKYNNSAVVVG